MLEKESDTYILPTPSTYPAFIYFWFGLGLQVLNKLRRSMIGYTSTRKTFDKSPISNINYNRQVLTGWMNYWSEFVGMEVDLAGKNVLELGPGSDLGLGSIVLAKGANKYYALDVFDLASGYSEEYYLKGLQHIEQVEGLDQNLFPEVVRQVIRGTTEQADRFHYVLHPKFNIDVLPENEMDCVFSNAAFQQFDDPANTIEQLTRAVKPGGIFVSTIDFTTHTRWIKELDPLNIYRYPKFIYEMLRFKGSPNRFHTEEYLSALKSAGWKNIQLKAMKAFPEAYVAKVQGAFSSPYNDRKRDMSVANLVIFAQNGKAS